MAAFTNSTALLLLLLLLLPLLLIVQASMFAMAENVLYSGERLKTNEALTSGQYNFIMQPDCNLVLYDDGRAIWSSRTARRGSGCNARLQKDGNLVIYSKSNKVIWASNTPSGTGNYVLILQKDRNVVIYGVARWSTKTKKN